MSDEDATIMAGADGVMAETSAVPMPKAKIICLDDTMLNAEQKGLTVELVDSAKSFGRKDDNDVPIKYGKISGRHARVFPQAGQWWIEDLNSTNGVLIAGSKVKQHQLKPGDEFSLASLPFRFELERPDLSEVTVPAGSVSDDDEDDSEKTMMFGAAGGSGAATDAILNVDKDITVEEVEVKEQRKSTLKPDDIPNAGISATAPPAASQKSGKGKFIGIILVVIIVAVGVFYYPQYQAQQEIASAVESVDRDLKRFIKNVGDAYSKPSDLAEELEQLRKLNSKVELARDDHGKILELENLQAKISFLLFERQFISLVKEKNNQKMQRLVANNKQQMLKLHNTGSDSEINKIIQLIDAAAIMGDLKQFSWRFSEARRDAAEKPTLVMLQDLQAKKQQFVKIKKSLSMLLVSYPLFDKLIADTAERELTLLDAWSQIVK